ncbi:hypothetical protein [Myroides sp. NP-2]|uniref:hypothetical protein n=1 Tax=Myroides sp. NP-2 TaxID=2759945 RepID=UPI0021057CA8|nr:hypothetical protein [Myroides sp. NP-2]
MSDTTSIKLSQYSKLLDRLLNELKTDKFANDIWQCYKQESYAIVYKELDSIDFEVLLIELRNNNFSKEALYNIISIIDKLNLLFEEYKTQIQSLDLYKLYHKVYISHFFDDKIKLAIEDLKHVQEREIPLEAPKASNT